MSWFKNLTAFFVALTAFAVGSVLSNYAWQFQTVSRVVDQAPVRTTLASLAAKGPGKTVHVELADFKFGEPLIEKKGERWQCVWLPLVRTTGKTSTPAVFFRPTRIRDQAQLDELREQKSLRVFVANSSLTKSVWGATASNDLMIKYPNIDFAKLTLVTEPDLEVPLSSELAGKPLVLTTDVLLSPTTRYVAWGSSGGLFLIGGILMLFLIAPNHRVTVTQAVCNVDKSENGISVTTKYLSSIPAGFVRSEEAQRERERLQHEVEHSNHQYRDAGRIRTVVGISLGLLLFAGIVGALLFGSSQAGPTGPITAGGIGTIAASVFMFVVYFSKGKLDHNGRYVDVIQLCTSGIRWKKEKQIGLAAWSEIARIERVTVDVNRKKQAMAAQFGLVGALAASMGDAGSESELTRSRDTVALQLQSGEVMFFNASSLSDYVDFAQAIHKLHGNEARRAHGGGFDEKIARGLIVSGAPSQRTMQNYFTGR